MKNVIQFINAILVFLGILYLFIMFPLYSFLGVVGLIVILGIYDFVQKKHTILRNFPVVGHLRYLLEGIGPEIRQYFIEADTDGKPLNRNQRSYVYTRAKKQNITHPFGTEHNLQEERMVWLKHSIYPSFELPPEPRVKIGGPECTQPYESSLFNISAMSYGSLSKNAITALNKGAHAGNFCHNTGEGSISPYHQQGGDLCYQIGTGYFGCRTKDGVFSDEKFIESSHLPEVKMIEIKLSQGAKPGHGGVLPAAKNNKEIAGIRGVEPHTKIVSPPGHTTFSDAEGLLKFVAHLRKLSGGKPVGFKLCVGDREEFEDICVAMNSTGISPDFITVDGAEGGTGAAPITFSDHVGMPWENALLYVSDTLVKHNLRKNIVIITSGKIIDGFDLLRALCLGADVCNSARGMMLALGCIQALECHKNTCPTGVTTNNERLMRGLVVKDKWERVKNYHEAVIHDFLELLMATGCKDINELDRSYLYKQVDGKSISIEKLHQQAVKGDAFE